MKATIRLSLISMPSTKYLREVNFDQICFAHNLKGSISGMLTLFLGANNEVDYNGSCQAAAHLLAAPSKEQKKKGLGAIKICFLNVC